MWGAPIFNGFETKKWIRVVQFRNLGVGSHNWWTLFYQASRFQPINALWLMLNEQTYFPDYSSCSLSCKICFLRSTLRVSINSKTGKRGQKSFWFACPQSARQGKKRKKRHVAPTRTLSLVYTSRLGWHPFPQSIVCDSEGNEGKALATWRVTRAQPRASQPASRLQGESESRIDFKNFVCLLTAFIRRYIFRYLSFQASLSLSVFSRSSTLSWCGNSVEAAPMEEAIRHSLSVTFDSLLCASIAEVQ
jgi:hypothetical protein